MPGGGGFSRTDADGKWIPRSKHLLPKFHRCMELKRAGGKTKAIARELDVQIGSVIRWIRKRPDLWKEGWND